MKTKLTTFLKPSFLFLAFFSLVNSSTFVFAKTYQWVDKNGVTHFTEYEPDPNQVSTERNQSKVNPNQIAEKEEYRYKRALLDEQISQTINDLKRSQLKRQRQVLDYQWFLKHDPAKAQELKAEMDTPVIRVIPTEEQTNTMDRMKAFY